MVSPPLRPRQPGPLGGNHRPELAGPTLCLLPLHGAAGSRAVASCPQPGSARQGLRTTIGQ